MKHFLFLVVLACFGTMSIAQNHSVLSEGNWVKVSTSQAGIYKLTYSDLQSMGVDVSHLSSDNLNLYGFPAEPLPEVLTPDFIYDLQKMAIDVEDGGDGLFDAGDFLLFYAQGPVTWQYNKKTDAYRHILNPYTNKVYYFLRTDDSNPKRLETIDNNNLTPTDTIKQLTFTMVHEKELYNPMHSGRTWLGELFADTTEHSYSIDLPDYEIKGGKMYLQIASNDTAKSPFIVYVNGNPVDTIQTIGTGSPINTYFLQSDTIDLSGIENRFDIKFVYNRPNDSAFVYLNYFELNLNSEPFMADPYKPVSIKSHEAGGEEIFYYTLANTQANNLIWDVTDPMNVALITSRFNNNTLSFIDNRPNRYYYLINIEPASKASTRKLVNSTRENGNDFLQPELIGNIPNENLIGMATPGLIIITNNELRDAAIQLAAYHAINDSLLFGIFFIQNIYNEFSGGRKDPTAIRNFIAQKLKSQQGGVEMKYVLLLGPASFDYRGILFPETNQVPSYETENSHSLINSYANDTYFTTINNQFIPVGRIPVSSKEEADGVVDKILSYHTSSRLTTWKNKAVIMADNGIYNLFMMDSDFISDSLLDIDFNLNQTKLYLSLFPAVNGGYPQVKSKLLNMLNDGVFYVNYTGSGGPERLTSEGVFTVGDAMALENSNIYPVWVNASGGTAKFDDPSQQSVNKALVLNPNGGAIVSVGNTAPGYGSVNRKLNKAFVSYLFDSSHKDKTFGDAYAYAVSLLPANRMVWSFLGDPALKPVWPVNSVQTTKINGEEVTLFNDTILPGSLLSIEGNIVDASGNTVDNFTGKIRATVYDMPYIKETIEGEQDPVREVTLYDSVLTMNCMDVKNGHFIGNVRLPAKYHELYGHIKISYYAHNDGQDASDTYGELIYGGHPIGIQESSALAALTVYPTPFRDHINLFVPQKLQQSRLQLTLKDVTGRTVFFKQIKPFNTDKVSLTVPDLPQGLYILDVQSTPGNRAFKLIRQ